MLDGRARKKRTTLRARAADILGRAALGVALVGAALTGAGCAPTIGGRASFPVVARGALPGYEAVAQVDEQRCIHVALFLFAWGDDENHEALVTELLERHKGDAIVDAELTFFSIPALVYHRSCARVKGTVVRKVASAVAASTREDEVSR